MAIQRSYNLLRSKMQFFKDSIFDDFVVRDISMTSPEISETGVIATVDQKTKTVRQLLISE